MKKVIQVAVPALLLIAMVTVYQIKPAQRKTYADILGHEAIEDILFWSERGVMSGSEGEFRPEGHVTLAELATVFCRVLPLEEVSTQYFADVEEGSWYEEPVRKCVAAGIIESQGRENLYPGEELSREEAFVMMARAMNIPPKGESRRLDAYNDGKYVSDACRGYMEALLEAELIAGGNEAQLYPTEPLTRGELCMALTKLRDGGYLP